MEPLVSIWLFIFGLSFIYLFLIWNSYYWKKLNVNGPKPEIIFGNLPSLLTKKRHVMYDIWDIYEEYKNKEDFVGIFKNRTPQLLILKPELVKKIYVNDFKYFHDNETSLFVNSRVDYLFANNPFTAAGEKWKQLRSEIMPGLTIGRVKMMHPVTKEICKRLNNYIAKQLRAPPSGGVDGKDLCSRYMADILADSVLGLQSDSFSEVDGSSPILDMQNQMFEYSAWYQTLIGLFPSITKFYKKRLITKKFEKYFIDLMQKSIDLRKSSETAERSDFLSHMIKMQEKNDLSTKEIAAHAMTFLLDGFETVSTIMAHCLLLLASNHESLEKLRKEIVEHKEALNDFDTLNSLPYLNACLHESMRLFPVVFSARKVCTESTVLQNTKTRKTLKVPKGMIIHLPLYHIMVDGDIYENPFEFQPERFLEENGGVKKYMDLGAYWGYGDGPRICLGIRFGLVQIKTALVNIVSSFNIKPNPKTRSDYAFDAKYFLARLDGGVWLDFESL